MKRFQELKDAISSIFTSSKFLMEVVKKEEGNPLLSLNSIIDSESNQKIGSNQIEDEEMLSHSDLYSDSEFSCLIFANPTPASS